jgi:hypothetical protein
MYKKFGELNVRDAFRVAQNSDTLIRKCAPAAQGEFAGFNAEVISSETPRYFRDDEMVWVTDEPSKFSVTVFGSTPQSTEDLVLSLHEIGQRWPALGFVAAVIGFRVVELQMDDQVIRIHKQEG